MSKKDRKTYFQILWPSHNIWTLSCSSHVNQSWILNLPFFSRICFVYYFHEIDRKNEIKIDQKRLYNWDIFLPKKNPICSPFKNQKVMTELRISFWHLMKKMKNSKNTIIVQIVNFFKISNLFFFPNFKDPKASPMMWVSKWVDYSDKYGFGYALCDESIGVVFNDLTKLLLLSDGR